MKKKFHNGLTSSSYFPSTLSGVNCLITGLFLLLSLVGVAVAQQAEPSVSDSAETSSLSAVTPTVPVKSTRQQDTFTFLPTMLDGYEKYSTPQQEIVQKALELAGMGLTYQYGSADPKSGGMDCSGAINYLLKQIGVENVPRQSNMFYRWTWQEDTFFAVNGTKLDSFEFSKLEPGDLLFWTNTYKVDRNPPVTHVMIYLGEHKETGKLVMFGASSGRRYLGKRVGGVSVIDFTIPTRTTPDSRGLIPRFIGYARIPGLLDK